MGLKKVERKLGAPVSLLEPNFSIAPDYRGLCSLLRDSLSMSHTLKQKLWWALPSKRWLWGTTKIEFGWPKTLSLAEAQPSHSVVRFPLQQDADSKWIHLHRAGKSITASPSSDSSRNHHWKVMLSQRNPRENKNYTKQTHPIMSPPSTVQFWLICLFCSLCQVAGRVIKPRHPWDRVVLNMQSTTRSKLAVDCLEDVQSSSLSATSTSAPTAVLDVSQEHIIASPEPRAIQDSTHEACLRGKAHFSHVFSSGLADERSECQSETTPGSGKNLSRENAWHQRLHHTGLKHAAREKAHHTKDHLFVQLWNHQTRQGSWVHGLPGSSRTLLYRYNYVCAARHI